MARKKRSTVNRFSDATQTAAAMHTQDIAASSKLTTQKEQGVSIPLTKIKQRTLNTRALNPIHLEQLQESIAALGLLEPLVVDQQYTLLAGGHRLESLRQLKQDDPNRFESLFPEDCIPVRVMGFNAKTEPDKALAVEVAENEHRRDYSSEEVRELAGRLLQQGYVYRKGKPAKGEKPLGPALEVIIGKHRRTVRRYLESVNRTGDLLTDKGTAPKSDKLPLKEEFYRLAKSGRSSPAWKDPKKQREIKSLLSRLEKLFSS